jgi:hypothetical protein
LTDSDIISYILGVFIQPKSQEMIFLGDPLDKHLGPFITEYHSFTVRNNDELQEYVEKYREETERGEDSRERER